jgi:hypothetical protein
VSEARGSGAGARARDAGAIQWRRSIAWLLFLGPFFFLSYGAANQWAAGLEQLGSIRYDWERAIPFVPWTIVPYWSIDLLYGLAFLFCRSARAVDRLAWRLLGVQLVSVACFVLFPLRFGGGQSEVAGVFAPLFDALRAFDQPFNQAPSLHIGLLVVIWAQFVRHSPPRWRGLIHAWALLIGVSVLTTWQHHFIDLPTGALVGALALWLWPDEGDLPLAGFRLTQDTRRRQLAARYAAGAAVFALPVLAGGAWLWSLWVAVSLALLALIHLGPGGAGLQKTHGRHSLAVRMLLAPYLLGARINQRLWSRRRPDRDLICDDVWLGALPARLDPIDGRLPALVDLTAELAAPHTAPHSAPHNAARYRNHAWLDLVPPSPVALAAAAHSIEALRAHGPVLVCCALGYGRSAAAVAAWLVLTGRAPDAAAAIARIRARRPRIVLHPPHLHALEALAPHAPCATIPLAAPCQT